MKTCWLLATMLILSCGSLPAGDVYHPNSNPASGVLFGLPFTNQEVRYQALIPAAALGGKPRRIVDLAFAPGAAGTFTASPFEVTMGHLATTLKLGKNFAANIQKNKTVMFVAGPIKWQCRKDQWCPLGLTGTFGYNGVDNVVVELRFRGGTGGVQCRSAFVVVQFLKGTGSYNASAAGSAIPINSPKIRLTYRETRLVVSGAPSPGGTINLDLLSDADAGSGYQLGSSFGTGPISIDTRLLNLAPDVLLVLSVGGTVPNIFEGYAGTLDAQGKAKAKVRIPSISALKGVRIHSAFVTLLASAPSGVANISNTDMFTIQ